MKVKHKKYFAIFENLVSLFFLKFVDLILPIILVPYLLENVGIKNYGYYAFANSIFIYLLNISQYGFFLSAVRDISVNRNNKKDTVEIFNKVFFTKSFIVGINLLILGLIVFLVPGISKHWEMYFFISLMLIGDLFTPSWYFYGIEKMRYITIINVVLKSTFLFLAITFIKQETDYKFITFYQSIGYILAGFISFYLTIKKFDIIIKSLSFSKIWEELKYGFSSFLSLVSPSIFTNTVVFVVGIYLTSKDVALTQVSIVVIGSYGALNTIMTNVLYPFVNNNKETFGKIKFLFLISGVVLSLIMYFSAPYIINIWVGQKFDKEELKDIYLLVKIASPSPILMSIVSIYGVNGLLVFRKDKVFSFISIISTLSCIFFAFILTPIFSFIGSVFSLILGRLVYALMSFYYFKKYKIEK